MSDYIAKVKYHTEESKKHPLTKIRGGDWIDLYTAEDVFMEAGDYKEISLGISLQLPPKFECVVAPRSSTFKKYGILCVNSIGVIDNSYHGNEDVWKFPALCMVGKTYIPAGTRIAQFRIFRNMPSLEFKTVERMPGRNRGGIGSTGE